MTWKIEFDDSASKEFKRLDKSSQKMIRDYLRDRVLKLAHPQDLGKTMKYGNGYEVCVCWPVAL